MSIRWGLVLFFTFFALQRMTEVWLSARHTRTVKARGAVESGRVHFPLLVAVHSLYPVCVIGEVLYLKAHPGHLFGLWIGVFLLAEILRYWAIVSLGERWNIRIWVIPGAPLVSRGPYRFMRHPNYLAVILEFIAGPMIFGAWRSAVLISSLNLAALSVRISTEERALLLATGKD